MEPKIRLGLLYIYIYIYQHFSRHTSYIICIMFTYALSVTIKIVSRYMLRWPRVRAVMWDAGSANKWVLYLKTTIHFCGQTLSSSELHSGGSQDPKAHTKSADRWGCKYTLILLPLFLWRQICEVGAVFRDKCCKSLADLRDSVVGSANDASC